MDLILTILSILQMSGSAKKQKVSYVVLLPMVYVRNDSQGYILLQHRVTVSSDRIEGEKSEINS